MSAYAYTASSETVSLTFHVDAARWVVRRSHPKAVSVVADRADAVADAIKFGLDTRDAERVADLAWVNRGTDQPRDRYAEDRWALAHTVADRLPRR